MVTLKFYTWNFYVDFRVHLHFGSPSNTRNFEDSYKIVYNSIYLVLHFANISGDFQIFQLSNESMDVYAFIENFKNT